MIPSRILSTDLREELAPLTDDVLSVEHRARAFGNNCTEQPLTLRERELPNSLPFTMSTSNATYWKGPRLRMRSKNRGRLWPRRGQTAGDRRRLRLPRREAGEPRRASRGRHSDRDECRAGRAARSRPAGQTDRSLSHVETAAPVAETDEARRRMRCCIMRANTS